MKHPTLGEVANLIHGEVGHEILSGKSRDARKFRETCYAILNDKENHIGESVVTPPLVPPETLLCISCVPMYEELERIAKRVLGSRYNRLIRQAPTEPLYLRHLLLVPDWIEWRTEKEEIPPASPLLSAIMDEVMTIGAGYVLSPILPTKEELVHALAEVYSASAELREGQPWESLVDLWRAEHRDDSYVQLAEKVASDVRDYLDIVQEMRDAQRRVGN